eukprot:SAG11_NODE_11586_length_750_cov_8.374808_1_plen_85_part_10
MVVVVVLLLVELFFGIFGRILSSFLVVSGMGLCPKLFSSSWIVTGDFGAVLVLFGVGSGSSSSLGRAVFRGLAAGLVFLTILDGK